jgi:hypothetical protein
MERADRSAILHRRDSADQITVDNVPDQDHSIFGFRPSNRSGDGKGRSAKRSSIEEVEPLRL